LIVSGIDEAGLGPLLGPYCAGLTTIEYKGDPRDPRKLCYAVLRETPEPGKLAVGDSKQIYSPGKLSQLEKTVLSFFRLNYGSLPGKGCDLLKKILKEHPQDGPDKEPSPWEPFISSLDLPLAASRDDIERLSDKLQRQFEKKQLILKDFEARRITPSAFNRLLDNSTNKAAVCQKILSPLMKKGLYPKGKLTVDRQGGRRYYGEWLIELYPGEMLTARQETAKCSLYNVGSSEVSFLVGGDAFCFETALASMIAKYLRELCMCGFNRYWQTRLPGIKKTAGYYSDGKRFLNDLKEAGVLPEDTSGLIRRK
jgi:ribonuclease HII